MEIAPNPSPTAAFPGYGEQSDLGANWHIKFADADGIPLNMVSFEQIDFGAIAYKEIFQNVKTILATPIYSAALERLLGVDQNIVDLPVDKAAEATVAILDALYFWEPRVEVINISFETDLISGRLGVKLQLNIRNVIYGTDTPYDRNNIFDTPMRVSELPGGPPMPPSDVVGPPGPTGPQGPAGPSGAPGQRGSLWFTGTTDPVAVVGAVAQDMYLNTVSGAVFQYDGSSWRKLRG
jgi:phage baseplate assembly protein W